MKWTRVHWIGLAAGFALLGDSALYVVLPTERERLGLTALQVGVLLSANRFVRIVVNDPTARAVDQVGLRAPVVLALAVAAATTFGYAWASFAAFVALRIAWGVAWSLLRNGASAAVLDEPVARRGELQGTFRSFARVGSLTAVLGGAWLCGRYGWEAAWMTLALATVPGLFLVGLSVSGAGRSVTPAAGWAPQGPSGILGASIAAFLVNAAATSLLLATVAQGVHQKLLSLVSGALLPRGALTHPSGGLIHFESATLFGVNMNLATIAGVAVAGRWLGEIAIAPLAGALSDRIGRRPVLALSGFLAAGALGGCATAGMIEAFVPATIFAFAMLSAFQAALDAHATDRASGTVALGRYFTAVDVGTAVGPLIGPVLVDRFEGLTYAGAALVVTAASLAYLPRRSRQAQ
jgi:MFS family permease